MSGSQGNVKFRLINDRQVAIKETKYDDRSLELEARVSKLITEKCPELIDFFPELISFRDNQLITTRILGEELCDMISRVRRANCRNLRAKSVQIIRNICQIILCVMETVTRKTGIVHNDLHASNVIISKTTNETFTFNFDNDKTYTIKSYGYIPVIIDFGYAHIEGELLGSLQNSDIGYTLEYKDRLADARLILKTAFQKFDKHMRMKINKIFEPLNLNKDGWFPKIFLSVYDIIYDIADVNPSYKLDATMTNVISRISGLDSDEICYCSEDCYLYYMESCEESIDEPMTNDLTNNHTNPQEEEECFQLCTCAIRLQHAFRNILPLEPFETREPCKQVLDAAAALKNYVILILNVNKRAKQHFYSKLEVNDSLDVIDCLFVDTTDKILK